MRATTPFLSPRYQGEPSQVNEYELNNTVQDHHITSHGVDGRRPEEYTVILSFIRLILIHSTPVSGASEIGFIVINHFLT